MGEIIAAHAVIFLEVPDDGLDGRAPSHVTFDLRGDAALLAGGTAFLTAPMEVAFLSLILTIRVSWGQILTPALAMFYSARRP
jgi:hypothetical protein